jgi:serine protease AprX
MPEYTGRGVVVAFLDAGFFVHPDIAGRILAHVDCTTADFSVKQEAVPAIESYVWHGQMSSVIAAGDGKQSGGKYRGIASESRLVLIKVSSADNLVKEGDILRGFHWLLKHHAEYNIRVVNVSVGGDFHNLKPDHALHIAVRDLVAQGVVVVIAAGNKGERHLLPPASAPEAIVVGGYNDMNTTNRSEWREYHSNYGVAHDLSHRPDVIAPSIWVASPILPVSQVAKEARWLGGLLNGHTEQALEAIVKEGHADLELPLELVTNRGEALYHRLQHRLTELKLINAHYQHVEGTSVAAPIVTSIVAQMLEAAPDLTPDQIRIMIRHAGQPVHGIPPQKQGTGAIDGAKAVRFALELSGTRTISMTRRKGNHASGIS